MPELPEVETVVRDLRAAGFQGARVAEVRILRPGCIAGATPDTFRRLLIGRVWLHINRRAKYIRVTLDNDSLLLIHLRMTGRLLPVLPSEHNASEIDPHDRIVLHFSDGHALRFHDSRAFGRMRLVAPGAPSPLDALGPEPLEATFTASFLFEALHRRHRQLKPLLLDQTFLAGLGNIYVDESLWAAGLHPARTAASVTLVEARRLHRAIRATLRSAIVSGGTSLGSAETNFISASGLRGAHMLELNVFRRQGRPCPRCDTMIERFRMAQRGTHICPQCQRAPT